MEIGQKLYIMRHIQGKKSKDVAEESGISQAAYSDYENNKTKTSPEMLEKFANSMGVTADAIENIDKSCIFHNCFHNQTGGNSGKVIVTINVEDLLKFCEAMNAPFQTQMAQMQKNIDFLQEMLLKK